MWKKNLPLIYIDIVTLKEMAKITTLLYLKHNSSGKENFLKIDFTKYF